AVPGHGEFADVRRMSDGEIDLLVRWVAEGAPEGDAKDLPAPRTFPSGWTLGTPSVVLAMEEPFTVPPRTRDVYRCFSVPIRLPGLLASAWGFSIPAGAPRTAVRAMTPVQEDLEAIAVHAHMHLIGREMTVIARLPNGRTEPLLRIDDWDFDWQLLYYFKRS